MWYKELVIHSTTTDTQRRPGQKCTALKVTVWVDARLTQYIQNCRGSLKAAWSMALPTEVDFVAAAAAAAASSCCKAEPKSSSALSMCAPPQ
jgi:hypothetical protein